MQLKHKGKNVADPKNWIDMLPEMLDNCFLIMGNEEKFIYYELCGEEVLIITDAGGFKKKRTVSLQLLPEFISEWMPIAANFNNDKAVVTYKQQITGPVLAEVKDILLENIKSVQADKNYIPQAIEVRETADKIIDLAKVEIDYIRTLNKLNS